MQSKCFILMTFNLGCSVLYVHELTPRVLVLNLKIRKNNKKKLQVIRNLIPCRNEEQYTYTGLQAVMTDDTPRYVYFWYVWPWVVSFVTIALLVSQAGHYAPRNNTTDLWWLIHSNAKNAWQSWKSWKKMTKYLLFETYDELTKMFFVTNVQIPPFWTSWKCNYTATQKMCLISIKLK